ncbi:MAG TPA: MFS transporter [Candidatus Angelobacter sp.]|jgi:MFS family permease|nr:MFS transporter [Candidatus Angelobacter sp.]
MPPVDKPKSAGRAAFRYPDFIRFQTARFFTILLLEMSSVAIGWQVYDITHRPLDLGYVGLIQFVPGILLILVTGQAADRFDRRTLLACCYCGFAVSASLMVVITLHGSQRVLPIYLVLLLLGVLRAFNAPTGQALLPQLLPEEHFPNAVAWGASILQGGVILGPALGGVIYAVFRSPLPVYVASLAAALVATFAILRIKPRREVRPRQQINLSTVLAGFRYVWEKKLILGSISLDLFAVLLGGAVALLPVYAREILKTGPWGLGLLRSAPGVGAAIMAILLAHRPLRRRAGATMLWCVAGFGVFTIVFGLSRNLVVSLLSLLLVGASDTVSVVIRLTLVQLATPDEMRGRVSAVNMLFIGASNELGQFESGLTAQWFGTVPAVVLGGIGTLVVIATWAWLFPELRHTEQFYAIPGPEKSVAG